MLPSTNDLYNPRDPNASMEFVNGMFAYHGRLQGAPTGWYVYSREGGDHWCTTDCTCAAREALVPGGREALEQAKAYYAGRIKLSGQNASDFSPPAPEGLAYMPYQRAGVEYLLSCKRGLLADEMGLGKTIQAIGVMNVEEIRPVLIVCPASLKGNWERELRKWLTYWATIHTVYSKDWKSADIVIINYDILERHKKELYAKEWGLVVLDEVHYLKNPASRRTACVFGTKVGYQPIAAKRVIAVTGTPIPNRPIELQSLLRYLDPYGWSSRKRYADRYCGGMRRDQYGNDMARGASHLDELNERLRGTLMIRRMKTDVLTDLPPKVRSVVPIEIAAADRRAIRVQDEKLRTMVGLKKSGDFDSKDFDQAVRSLSIKKESMGELGELAQLRRLLGEAKVATACIHIEETIASMGKVVVFGHHKSVLNAIKDYFGNSAVMITGQTPSHKRQEIVEQFQNNDKVTVFVGNIIAAGVGITLTASSEVIFVEGDWVPGQLSQAEDRCHRIGQQDTVFVRHLVVEDTLDAVMARAVVGKQDNIRKALDVAPEMEYAV